MEDPFDLSRFVAAQHDVYDAALAEIRKGSKRSHWMWFIFPQVAGLGRSAMSARYAIRSLDEAHAYLQHPLLGRRLRECVNALQDLPATMTADDVFGPLDASKLLSSLTLFNEAKPEPLFGAAIDRWFGGVPDAITIARLADPSP